ncbi:MAG: hypothetical protein F6K19_40535 [Cyanothece sp. SIO1E1]|nr:hypothetical protein [Cyanothece sp. SIO1E1]
MSNNPFNPQSIQSEQAQVELALLQSLLSGDRPYPWNPAEPESETYFAEIEQACEAPDLSVQVTANHWQTLSMQLDKLWSDVSVGATPQESANPSLKAALMGRFATRMPENLLNTIARQAQQVLAANLSLSDQLVNCVQDILPAWDCEDLQVLARPLAHAMRGGDAEVLEVALRSVRFAAWTELSGVEQARLSLAIARYAIAQLNTPNTGVKA